MADKSLDLRKEICPKSLILTMSSIKTLQKGEVLTVVTNDASTRQAIPKFCERAGFTLLEMTEEGDTITFRIER